MAYNALCVQETATVNARLVFASRGPRAYAPPVTYLPGPSTVHTHIPVSDTSVNYIEIKNYTPNVNGT